MQRQSPTLGGANQRGEIRNQNAKIIIAVQNPKIAGSWALARFMAISFCKLLILNFDLSI
jgi:hypothetical protein